jgi:hypothetical protein
LHALAPYRPDLKKTASEKLAVIRNVIGMIRDAGFELVPLRSVAERLSERPNP